MIKYLLLLLFSSALSASSYTEVNGEWRDTKEPRIVIFNFDNMTLAEKGIYEGPFSYEENSVKMYGLAEFHEKTNELYVNYTSQVIDGKETHISEWAKYIVYLGQRKDGLRYVFLFSPKNTQVQLGGFYFYRSLKK